MIAIRLTLSTPAHDRDSAILSCRRVPPVIGPRGSRSSSLWIIVITDRPSYIVVDCRRSSFSGRRCPQPHPRVSNELPRHVTSPSSHKTSFLQSSEDSSFRPLIFCLCGVPVKPLLLLSATLISLNTYLLTYLLIDSINKQLHIYTPTWTPRSPAVQMRVVPTN